MNPDAAKILRGAAILVFILLVSFPARAQAGGVTLSGTVTDASGGAIANANVSIRSLSTGQAT